MHPYSHFLIWQSSRTHALLKWQVCGVHPYSHFLIWQSSRAHALLIWQVCGVHPETKAHTLGLRAGDVVVSVDGVSCGEGVPAVQLWSEGKDREVRRLKVRRPAVVGPATDSSAAATETPGMDSAAHPARESAEGSARGASKERLQQLRVRLIAADVYKADGNKALAAGSAGKPHVYVLWLDTISTSTCVELYCTYESLAESCDLPITCPFAILSIY